MIFSLIAKTLKVYWHALCRRINVFSILQWECGFRWICARANVSLLALLQWNNNKNISTGIMLEYHFMKKTAHMHEQPFAIICRLCHTNPIHCCYWRHWIGRAIRLSFIVAFSRRKSFFNRPMRKKGLKHQIQKGKIHWKASIKKNYSIFNMQPRMIRQRHKHCNLILQRMSMVIYK